MPPKGYVSRHGRCAGDTLPEPIPAMVYRATDPDLALIMTVVESDMNDHAKMRVIEKIVSGL